MKKRKTFIMTAMVLFMFVAGAVQASDEYPLRAKYPDVKVMTTQDLNAGFDAAIVVDVRSTMEFDVAHVNKAKHVPISKATFIKDLEKVREKKSATSIVFYCNGHTCAKSYKAAQQTAAAGFDNVYAYDSGIFDWIMAFPDKATFMGRTPAPKEKIIPKSELSKRMLSFAEFKKAAEAGDVVVIDIRDPFQRKKIPSINGLRNIPLDRLTKLLQQKEFSGKKLLLLDAVGKQVRWIQYYLVENGYTDYAFLEKGVAGIQ